MKRSASYFLIAVAGLFFCATNMFSKESLVPPLPEEIAKVVGEDIEDSLRKAQADMGNGVPELKLVKYESSAITYKGSVTFSSGPSSFNRAITVVYDGKTVVYSYDDSKNKYTVTWSDRGAKKGLVPPDLEEIAEVVGDDISVSFKKEREDTIIRGPGLKVVEYGSSAITYKGSVAISYFYSGDPPFGLDITVVYDGKTVVYSYDDDDSGEKHTVTWSAGSGGGEDEYNRAQDEYKRLRERDGWSW